MNFIKKIFLLFISLFSTSCISYFKNFDNNNSENIILGYRNNLWYKDYIREKGPNQITLDNDFQKSVKEIFYNNYSLNLSVDSTLKNNYIILELFFNPKDLRVGEVYFVLDKKLIKLFKEKDLKIINNKIKKEIIGKTTEKWIGKENLKNIIDTAKYLKHYVPINVYYLSFGKKNNIRFDNIEDYL